MRRVIFIFIGILTIASFSFREGEEDVITWNKDRKLTWNDYRGKPKPRFAAASTVYSLGRNIYEENGQVIARLEAYFYCKDSWKKDDWISDEVLSHEQKHFDIVELYARKLRKQAQGFTCTGLKEAEYKIDSLYNILNKAMDVYQDQYDDETDGSMNGDEQRRWIRKIDRELKELDAYASTKIIIKIKSGN
jgi:hypothetical protein